MSIYKIVIVQHDTVVPKTICIRFLNQHNAVLFEYTMYIEDLSHYLLTKKIRNNEKIYTFGLDYGAQIVYNVTQNHFKIKMYIHQLDTTYTLVEYYDNDFHALEYLFNGLEDIALHLSNLYDTIRDLQVANPEYLDASTEVSDIERV